jgi:hypothetical protein
MQCVQWMLHCLLCHQPGLLRQLCKLDLCIYRHGQPYIVSHSSPDNLTHSITNCIAHCLTHSITNCIATNCLTYSITNRITRTNCIALNWCCQQHV